MHVHVTGLEIWDLGLEIAICIVKDFRLCIWDLIWKLPIYCIVIYHNNKSIILVVDRRSTATHHEIC